MAHRYAIGVASLSGMVCLYGLGCAADAGDALKVEAGPEAMAVGGSSGVSSDDSGFDSTEPDIGVTGSSSGSSSGSSTSSSSSSSGSGSGSSSGSSSSSSSGSSSGCPMATVADASDPDAAAGGCAAGATVVTLTLPDSGGQYSANSGNFNTAGAVCVKLDGSVHQGWGISNGQGRMLTLTSSTGTSGSIDASGSLGCLPAAPQAGPDGYVYWNFTAGSVNYTSIYIF